MKALMNEKDISPSQIIDDLTCCDNISKDNQSIGFIDNIPVIFEYKPNDNYMCITCKDEFNTKEILPKIRQYITDVQKSNNELAGRCIYFRNVIIARFEWKEGIYV